MRLIRHIRNNIKGIYLGMAPEWEHGFRRCITYSLRYIGHVSREVVKDQCLLRAAALTFTTLITLLPVFVLAFVLFRAFGGMESISSQVENFLFQHMLPQSVKSIQTYFQGMIGNVNSGAISIVSVIFLVFSAYSLFASVDTSLNAIWQVPRGRSFISRIVHLWFILTVSPFLLGYSLYLSAEILKYPGVKTGLAAVVVNAILWMTPLLLTWVTLTIIYKLVPGTHVNWSSAAIGGIFAAILWEISKYGFNVYFQYFTGIQRLYGSFLLLPLFLFWIHLSWTFVLGGAELAYTHQNLPMLHSLRKIHGFRQSTSTVYLSEKTGVRLMYRICAGFYSGKLETVASLQKLASLPAVLINLYIHKLEENKLIRVTDDNSSILPSRDPELIQINEVLDLFEMQGEETFEDCSVAFIGDLMRIRQKSLEKLNFKEAVKTAETMHMSALAEKS